MPPTYPSSPENRSFVRRAIERFLLSRFPVRTASGAVIAMAGMIIVASFPGSWAIFVPLIQTAWLEVFETPIALPEQRFDPALFASGIGLAVIGLMAWAYVQRLELRHQSAGIIPEAGSSARDVHVGNRTGLFGEDISQIIEAANRGVIQKLERKERDSIALQDQLADRDSQIQELKAAVRALASCSDGIGPETNFGSALRALSEGRTDEAMSLKLLLSALRTRRATA